MQNSQKKNPTKQIKMCRNKFNFYPFFVMEFTFCKSTYDKHVI